MTVAEMIKKTRADEDMTQEEYGDRFGVTRQTVSSWENGKSMPDLQLLINICNTYRLSLDILLNGDSAYVRRVAVMQKLGRVLKRTAVTLAALLSIFLVTCVAWKVRAVGMNEDFAASAAELGFELEDGRYVCADGDVTYILPNQKLPFMRFDFYVKQVEAEYRSADISMDMVLDGEDGTYGFTIYYGLDGCISGSIAADGVAKYDALSEGDREAVSAQGDNIEKTLREMAGYWEEAYQR